MTSSEANLVPANNSVAIEDVYNNKDEIADTNDENQLEEVIREKKEKFYEFKNSDNKNSEPIATNKRVTERKYLDSTAVIIGD